MNDGIARFLGSRSRLIGWALAAVVLAVLAGAPGRAQEQPTEVQILELLKQKRVLRCPINLPIPCGHAPAPGPGTEATQDMVEIRFAYGSTVIHPGAHATLAKFANRLNDEKRPVRSFLVVGHTDAKGGAEYNQNLSERRAEAVKRLLVEQFKLPPATLVAIGYGKTQLKSTADPFAGENRRVQIVESGTK